jgi:hypothetical protein
MSFRFSPLRLISRAVVIGSIAICAMASPITYDASAPLTSRFSGFTVTWNDIVFDFTNAANTGERFFGTDCGTTPSSQSVFAFLSGQNVCVNAATIYWDGNGTSGADGTFGLADQELSGSGPPAAAIDTTVAGAQPALDFAGGFFSIAPAAATPEPGTFGLIGAAGAAVLLLRRRLRIGIDRRTCENFVCR